MSGEGVIANAPRFAAHADFCGWHVDQYPWECTCGAIENPAQQRPTWLGLRPSDMPRDRFVRDCNVDTPARKDGAETPVLPGTIVEIGAGSPRPQCGVSFKAGWYCSRDIGHEGPCAAWPVSHEAHAAFPSWSAPAKQSKADSFMESVTNIIVGLAVSQAANFLIIPLVLGVPLSQRESLALGAAYTAVSLVRSYTLRRAFNGRTVWATIKAALA